MADQEQEFQEEEMWGVVLKQKERKQGFTARKMKSFSSSSCLSAAWQSPMHTAQEKMVSKAKNVTSEALQQKPSAPLKIPGCYNMQDSNNGDDYVAENEEDDDDEETMVPPHEYMAKKMARTRSASHSMCEGIGRTLKGRDLCKLRNAILTQTGFLEK